jgi:hypothetical protein
VPSVVEVLSHPFRFLPNGRAATVEQDTDDQRAELIAGLILTRPGERGLVPGFGTPDPVFAGIDVAAVEAATNVFGPDVRITDVRVEITGPASQDVTIEFE